MPKNNQTTTADQTKPAEPPPKPQIPASEPVTRKNPPPTPRIPQSEDVYKSWGDKKKDN
jgi:hypothetical protein